MAQQVSKDDNGRYNFKLASKKQASVARTNSACSMLLEEHY